MEHLTLQQCSIKWSNSTTFDAGTLERLMVEQWNRDGGTLLHLMVEHLNREGGKVGHLMVEQHNLC